ncbi:MAG: sortase [Patescibacteria group bacterium]
MDQPWKIIGIAFSLAIVVSIWFNFGFIWANIQYAVVDIGSTVINQKIITTESESGEVLAAEQSAPVKLDYQVIGIRNNDLAKIPIGFTGLSGVDTDGDWLPDVLEVALGTNSRAVDSDNDGYSDYEELRSNYNPTGSGALPINHSFANQQKGKLLLQVEANGELWYVAPIEAKRYYISNVGAISAVIALLTPKNDPATNTTNKKLGPNTLQISSLSLIVPVIYVNQATDEVFQQALERGVVHFPGTANPGEYGNDYIFGHSSDYRWRSGSYKSVFAVLPKIKIGAEILITNNQGVVFKYVVKESKVVAKTDIQYLGQYGYQRRLLTLQTSWPVGTALKRWVVIAELVN